MISQFYIRKTLTLPENYQNLKIRRNPLKNKVMKAYRFNLLFVMTHVMWLLSCFISHRMSNFSFSLHILTFWQFSYILSPWKLSSVHFLAYRCTHLGFYMWPTWKPPPPRHTYMWKLQMVGILHWPIWPKFSFCHFAETFLRRQFRIQLFVSYHRRRDK